MGCKCRAETVTPNQSSCPTGCIRGAYHIIHSIDSVGPCGAEGEYDLANDANAAALHAANLTTCGGPLTYKVEAYDGPSKEGFETVYMDGTKIKFVTREKAVVHGLYKITYSVYCSTLGKGDYGQVWVSIKDECAGVSCVAGQTCNRCTGICGAAQVDVSAGNDCLNC